GALIYHKGYALVVCASRHIECGVCPVQTRLSPYLHRAESRKYQKHIISEMLFTLRDFSCGERVVPIVTTSGSITPQTPHEDTYYVNDERS
ncbi:MAG: hypothetical protein FWD38_11670, partial [Oscillospiraceae bacterium]|nr:hypothetical protein [Oscillospiraceae bacterium]